MAGGSCGTSAVIVTRVGPSGAVGGVLVIGGNVNSCGRLSAFVGRVLAWPEGLEHVPSPSRGSSLLACVTNVSEVSLGCGCLNSLHGCTTCPEGAISSWNVSVPGGSDWSTLLFPGPRKCNFNVVKSRTARWFRRVVSPRSPGRSECCTDGIRMVPSLFSTLPLHWRKATGRLQS